MNMCVCVREMQNFTKTLRCINKIMAFGIGIIIIIGVAVAVVIVIFVTIYFVSAHTHTQILSTQLN